MVFPLPGLTTRGYFPITPMAKASSKKRKVETRSRCDSRSCGEDTWALQALQILGWSKWVFFHVFPTISIEKNPDEAYQILNVPYFQTNPNVHFHVQIENFL